MHKAKNDKKVQRKKQRLFALLSKGNDIQFSSSPTKVVVICNSGLTTGASRESVLERFLQHTPVSSVHMAPGRQFCFVQFDEAETAQRAVLAVDGMDGPDGEPPLYLAYAEQVPSELCGAPLSFGLPPDATLVTDLLTIAEEEHILGQLSWATDGAMKHRQVLHYGYEFNYDTNNVDPGRPLPGGLPEWVEPLVSRLMSAGHLAERPDQMTVNRYLPGQGIPPHVDTHSAFTDQLVSVSLGADTTMEFCRPPPRADSTAVRLPRRSALVMDGESRYLWTHCIVPRHSDVTLTSDGELTLTRRGTRVSLTLRRLRRAPCRCRFPQQCDSQQQQQTAAGEEGQNDQPATTKQLERTYVANVYERIADHFSCTRHKPWPRVEQFVRGLPAGSVLLDVGCGNGKYLGLNGNTFEVGVDQSGRLCAIGASRGHQTVTGGCLPLPVRDAACDAVICIAVLHHLATRERRVAALAEIARALRVGGRALVYVWALEQRQGTRAAGYLKPGRQQAPVDTPAAEDASRLPLPVHTNRTEFKQQDMLVPWKLKPSGGGSSSSGGGGGGSGGTGDGSGGVGDSNSNGTSGEEVHMRFYHVYRSGELEEDVAAAGRLTVIESYHDQGNWCVLMQKDADAA